MTVAAAARRRVTATALLTVPVLLLAPTVPATAAPGSTVRVSVTSDGTPAGGYSDSPVVSADGATVAFGSTSAALHPDGVEDWQYYAHDRASGTTELLSRGTDGQVLRSVGGGGPIELSADGRYAVFSWTEDEEDPSRLYRRDLVADATELVSVGADGSPASSYATYSVDGSGELVAFVAPDDLVGDGLGGGIFLRDLRTDATTRAGTALTSSLDLSGDGSTLVHGDRNADGVPVLWVRDVGTGVTEELTPGASDESYDPSLSEDGSRVVFLSYGTGLDPSDTNTSYDWFLADRSSGTVTMLNRTTTGTQVTVARAFLAADGRHVGLLGAPLDATGRTGLPNLYVKDLATGTVDYVAVDSSGTPVHSPLNNEFDYLSADGRYVTFASPSRDFVPDDTDDATDVFVHDNGAPTRTAAGSGTVTTDPDGTGATYEEPLQVTVDALGGTASITVLGSGTAPTGPSGYEVLGQAVDITATPAPAGQWLTLTFALDAAVVAATTDLASVTLSRDGTPLARCADADDPGPCVASVTRGPDGDVSITARTPQASRWVPLLRVAVPDTTPPTVTLTAPTEGQVVLLGAAVTVSYTCTDADSGVTTCSGTVPSGGALPTSQVGTRSFSVTATDVAGNSVTVNRSYQVVYDWRGFRRPIDDAPVVNTAKAGTIVPLSFSLNGNRGTAVLDGAPTATPTTCSRTAPVDKLETTLRSGAGSLTYSASSRTYTYGFAVPKSWAGSCRAVTLRLADGTTHAALFKVTK